MSGKVLDEPVSSLDLLTHHFSSSVLYSLLKLAMIPARVKRLHN